VTLPRKAGAVLQQSPFPLVPRDLISPLPSSTPDEAPSLPPPPPPAGGVPAEQSGDMGDHDLAGTVATSVDREDR
jgi:hypothetical protein